jgi:hypothetical protein
MAQPGDLVELVLLRLRLFGGFPRVFALIE